MGRNANPSTIQVFEGLYLHKVAGTQNLQAYFRLTKKTFWKSMGTPNVKEAGRNARDFYYKIKQDIEAGVTTKKISFNQIVKAYLDTIPPGSNYNCLR